MDTSTITLDRAYFETLLRRAHFHTTNGDLTTATFEQTVTIPKADHDSLLATARQYANLQRNLYRGGITDETLAILIQDDTPDNYTTFSTAEDTGTDGGVSLTQKQQSIPSDRGDGHGRQRYTSRKNGGYTSPGFHQRDNNASQSQFSGDEEDAYTLERPSDAFYDRKSRNSELIAKSSRQQYDKFAKRTILLTNLSGTTTLSDVVDAVRGGMLLDIYLRIRDRTVSVSFLEETHANEFFRYVKRNDLYIRGKRAMIRWSERQFILPGHIANKISIGATRNLVIHNRNPNHTEDAIREDLEHIHNLVVIKITFNGADAHISTNSVHNALFARTCMLSRTKYRECKIDWVQDECAAPIQPRTQSPKLNVASKKTATASLMNRFQLLNMDGANDDSQEEDDLNANGDAFGTSLLSPTVRVVA